MEMKTTLALIADTTRGVPDSVSAAAAQLRFDPSAIVNVDCNGNGNSIVIMLIGLGVVFTALLLLYIMFVLTTKMINWAAKRRFRLSVLAQTGVPVKKDMSIPAESTAAIGMALHLHFSEIHDIENTVITIKKVSKNYSPWNSKIYGLRKNPRAI